MRKYLIFALCSLLLLGGGFSPAVAAAAKPVVSPEETIYQDDQVQVLYRHLLPSEDLAKQVAAKFSPSPSKTGYLAQVRIKNLSKKQIDGWTLLATQPDQIKALLPAKLVSQSAGQVVVQNDRLTKTIKPNAFVVFWYWALPSGSVHTPTWVSFLNGNTLPTTDSDKDLLPDYIEQRAGLDPKRSDTDGDGLSDFAEWGTETDPLVKDTDGNGVSDAQEDPDGDHFVNIDEIAATTDPRIPDTDGDTLDDGAERTHRTDPKKPDTDGDGVTDGEEVRIGSDPLVKETSFDVTRTVTGGKTTPKATIDGLQPEQVKTFTVTQLPDNQQIPSTTPGFVDNGYEFHVDGGFTSADISFGFTPAPGFDPAIYTYDDATQRIVAVPDQRLEGNTVKATTKHFSKYFLLDRDTFETTWNYTFLEAPDPDSVYDGLDVAFTIDSSGSMLDNDPTNERVTVAKSFVSRLTDDDRGAVVDFDSTAVVRSPLTKDKTALNSALDAIDSSGGTSLTAGVSSALGTFGAPPAGKKILKTVILLTDGIGDYDPALTAQAKAAGVTIYTVGLGAGVDAGLLTSIAEGTGGKYYPAAEAAQLQGIFDSIAQQSDLLKDTDSDGVNDYYEKEMRAGHLVFGNGTPVGAMDQLNPDSDGDGLLDGQEIQIVSVPRDANTKLVYVFMKSNPLSKDTDGDGLEDRVDPLPLVFTGDLVIHQSANREGHRKEPDPSHFQVPPSPLVADDLTYNDYTGGELRDLGAIFWTAAITPEFLMWAEFNDIFNVGKTGASADAKLAVDQLTNSFRHDHPNGASGVGVTDNYDASKYAQIGTGSALSRAVAASPQEKTYTDKATQLIKASIVANKGAVGQFRLSDDLNRNLLYREFAAEGVQYPVYDFSATDGTQRALSIAIHQFHGHQIQLKNYRVSGNTYSGTLLFHSYDHFGLDPDDEIKQYGFVDWFTLQHYDRFDGRYVPALAIADVEIPISGSF